MPALALVRLSRPHFLIGGALFYAIGVASAGSITVRDYLLGQFAVSAAQLTAHYVNEYHDLEADRLVLHRTLFSGGSGVLIEWAGGRRFALTAAKVTTAITFALSVGLALVSPLAALLTILALSVSWLYSAPPVRLLGSGLGELTTSLVVTIVVPLVGVGVAGGGADPGLWWLVAPLLMIHLAMMLAFELPDHESDHRAGKHVLAVRVGVGRTVFLIGGLFVGSAIVLLIGIVTGALPGWLWMGLGLALVGGTAVVVAAHRARYPALTATAVATLASVGTTGLIGLS
ncbi:MAG: prenyltransferase [Acidimicrobiia bacterium]|nr:prenyltransferase [Acidimicrobiia bacterium]